MMWLEDLNSEKAVIKQYIISSRHKKTIKY